MSEYDDLFEVEEKPKRKRDEDPTTWADAWKALGIFAGTIVLVGTSMSVIQNIFLRDTFDSYMDITLGGSIPEVASFMDTYMNAFQNPIFLVLYMAIAIVIVFISLFIIYGIIHVFATKVQGGDGTLRALIVRANLLTVGTYVVYGIIASISNYFLMIRVVERYEGVNIMESLETLNEYNNFVTAQSSPSSIAFLAFWLIWSIGISFVAADNYQISKNKGCVSLILTNVSLVTLFCGCIFAVGFGVAGFVATLV